MIKLEHVSKKLGKFSLEDINIELPKGYICGLIGPNGSGKTTLLHLIMGLYKADVGEVIVQGNNFSENEAAIHDAMGVVLQERLFDNYMSLKENGSYYGRFYSNYDEAYLLEMLKSYDLDPKRKYKGLSKGEELKFQFACALAHHPKFLILDEPTAALDPVAEAGIYENFDSLVGEKTAVYISHRMSSCKFCDRIVVLDHGEIAEEGTHESLMERHGIYAELYQTQAEYYVTAQAGA